MDTALRDIDQLRERDDSAKGRQWALISMAAMAIAGVFWGVSGMISRADSDRTRTAPDALAALDRAADLAALDKAGSRAQGGTELPAVNPATLSFPNTLPDEENRPEVEAALAAALAESEHPDPIAGAVTPASDLAFAQTPPPIAIAPAALPGLAALPAVQQVDDDGIRPSASTTTPATPRAAEGREGVYTIQVSSVPDQNAARAFADALRTRGHEAFVVRAQIPDRGTFYRVRVGPFETQGSAERYRRTLEETEHLSTYVVRREYAETGRD